MGRGGARRSGAVALTCWTAVAAGCEPSVPRLETVPHLSFDVDAAETLHLDRSGRAWVGAPGGLIRMGADEPSVRISMPGAVDPRVTLEGQATLYALAGDELHAISRDSAGQPTARRAGFGGVPVLLDPRGRFLAQGARSGAVLGFDAETLEPVWAWPARGAPTAAIAATPEGDVVWQALSDSTGGSVLLERDLQTGRILDRHELSEDVVSIAAAPDGDLLLVGLDGERLVALRLRPRGAALDPVWREVIHLDGDETPVVRQAPSAGLLAIFRPGSDTGLRVVDAEAGVVVGTVEDTPSDAGFSAEGVLYVLTPGQIRRVVIDR